LTLPLTRASGDTVGIMSFVPSKVPVICINLERQPERKSKTRAFLKEMGFTIVHFVRGVDGEALLKAGGRSRKTGKHTWRLSFNSHESSDRESHPLNGNTLAAAGGSDVWGQLGCTLSHIIALEKALTLLQSCDKVLVIEDDCVIGPAANTTADSLRLIKSACRSFAKQKPDWVALLLGGKTMYDHIFGNGPSSVAGWNHADYCFQAHSIIWHRAAKTEGIIQESIAQMRKGLISDNALASVMKNHNSCFYFASPSIWDQDKKAGSNLQVVSDSGGTAGYAAAHQQRRSMSNAKLRRLARKKMDPKHVKNLGKDRRGTARIPKSRLKLTRKRLAADGGKVLAGGGCTAADVRKKTRLLRAAYERTGVFPTKTQAAERWAIGSSKWAALRKECLES
jgi:GR25 family glycosyltransferase involved in LPS biosynthesis